MGFWRSSKSLPETRFWFFMFIFDLGGFPLFIQPVSIFYLAYALIANVCTILMTAGLTLEVYKMKEDLDQSVEVSMFFCLSLISLWSQIYIRFHSAKLENLLRFTDIFKWEDLPQRDPDTGYLTSAAWISRIQKTTRLIVVPGLIFHFIQSAVRMLTSEERIFMFPTGVNLTSSPVYEIIILTQVIAVIPWVCFFYGVPSLFGTLVCVACSQLDKLRSDFMSIRQTCSNTAEYSVHHYELEGSEVQNSSANLQKQVNNCIRYHQSIIKFVQLMEDMFSPLLVGHFLVLMIALCFASYSAVARLGNLMQLSMNILIYGILVLIVALFCWFGSLLTQQAELVSEAAWNCDWVGAPISFQRCIAFIIAIANKKMVLTAGKCVPVSKETMMSMLQESISLFMFILQVKEDGYNDSDI